VWLRRMASRRARRWWPARPAPPRARRSPAPCARSARAGRRRCRRPRPGRSRSRWCRCRPPARRPRRRRASGPRRSRLRPSASPSAPRPARPDGDDARRHLVVRRRPPDELRRPLGLEQAAVGRLVPAPRATAPRHGPGSRCSAMAASKPARSTSTPASRASSSVSSTGKPWVSCRVKATSPPSTLSPVANASSNRPNPARRVRSKPASSRSSTAEDHVVVLDQRRVGLAQHLGGRLDQHRGDGLSTPSRRAARTARRTTRRST
jgi:hypothetical protein